MSWVFLLSFFSLATIALTQVAHLNFEGKKIGSLVDLNVLEDKHGAFIFLLSYLHQVHPQDGAPSYTTWRHSITRNGLVWKDFQMRAVPENAEVKQGSLFQHGLNKFVSVYSSRPKPERIKPTPKLQPGQHAEPPPPEVEFGVRLSILQDYNSVEHYPESLIKDRNDGNASPVLILVEMPHGEPVLVLVTIARGTSFCYLELHVVKINGKPQIYKKPATLRLYHKICTSLSIFRHPFLKNTFHLTYTGYDDDLKAFVTMMEQITVEVNKAEEDVPVIVNKLIIRKHIDGVPNVVDYVFREYKSKVYAMARTETAIKDLPSPHAKLNSVTQLRVLDLTGMSFKQLPLVGDRYRGPAALIQDRKLEIKGNPGADIACIAMDNTKTPEESNLKNPIAFVLTVNLSDPDGDADSTNNPKFEVRLSASRNQDVSIGYNGLVNNQFETKAVQFYVTTNTHDRPLQDPKNKKTVIFPVSYAGRPSKLEIYVDTNIIEVYADDGQYVLTAHYYFAEPDDRFEQACTYQLDKNYWISMKNAFVQKILVEQFPMMDDAATTEFIHKAKNNLNINPEITPGNNTDNGKTKDPTNHSSRLLLHPISICLLIGFFLI